MIFTRLISLVILAQVHSKPQTEYRADISDAGQYIVNGNDVEKGVYPWMLSLEVLDPQFRHTCGASLLDSRHAMTAAHCLDGRLETPFRVKIGCSFRGDEETPDDCEQIVNVAASVLHEDYNCPTCSGAFPNDIALMYLAEEVTMNENVAGAILGQPDIDYTGLSCRSSGWGKLNGVDDDVPLKLQDIEIDILSHTDCVDAMPVGGNINVNEDVHVCIFDTRSVEDSEKRGICQGDSGGPVQCDVNGEWYVLGAASWVIAGGIGSTCNPAFPGVYADVLSYLTWVQEKIDDDSWKPSI